MEYLSEECLKFLLHKEWLVKIDTNKSVPYLFKFYSSAVDQCCYLMITDTKEVWGEVLTSKQFARRWRDCNPTHAPPLTISDEEEDEWRGGILDLLSKAHSLGGVTDLFFDIVDSRNADLAFELGSSQFKWRWETYSLGLKISADVLSKHLIMPLISVTHLSFSSADPVSELSEAGLEKAVDKVGRTARRTVDTHVKHALSRPRVATTLRRMTAMFNFLPELPPIVSDVDKPELRLPVIQQHSRAHSKVPHHTAKATPTPSPSSSAHFPSEEPPSKSVVQQSSANVPQKTVSEESETERSSGEEYQPSAGIPKVEISSSPKPSSSASVNQVPSLRPPQDRVAHSSTAKENETSSDAEASSAIRPAKKAKRVQHSSSSSDDEVDEVERKRRVAQLKGSSARGAKQPLKRGGRRV